ncbi:MAG: hypothetical protein ACKJRP_03965 [SAR86 cluster bacterium]|tara:strand:- start:36193 stop:36513 length:321 start_codon:yes stop_codon:yes gene_type:complete
MITIDFTYDTVTPESAENGDVAECGFITPGFWRYPNIEDYERKQWAIGDLAYLIDFAKYLGITFDGHDFYSVDPDINYRTGEETRYGMHIDGVTPATEARIARLLD